MAANSGLMVFITVHSSVVYRQRDKAEQNKAYRRFVADMKALARWLQAG